MNSADATVVVATLNRPECLRRCMRALQAQTAAPLEIIVVDASRDGRSRAVMEEFPAVRYISAPEYYGMTPASRNRALLEARGGVIAFLDDDAYAHPDWLEALMLAYDGPCVGGVGGRALNGCPGEEKRGLGHIGELTHYGFLNGNFAANPGRVTGADHLLGCNMSFRREVLERLGGFREKFFGAISLCEETDFCLRARALGYGLRFQPAACVDHEGASQIAGRRFNAAYQFHQRLNNGVMLIHNYGWSAYLWKYPLAVAIQAAWALGRGLAGPPVRFAASLAGLLAGMACGLAVYVRNGADPIRRGPGAEAIQAALRSKTALSTSGSEEARR